MTTFRSWRERLVAAALPGNEKPNRIRYTRKSTESEDRQVASHQQQSDEMDAQWGPIDGVWLWQDSFTGTTFDRPEFTDMLAYCEANPRSRKSPGRVELYDPSRFGRSLDEDGQPDINKFVAVVARFESTGWQVEFKTMKRSGNQLIDMIMMAVHAYAAASFSVTLSTNTRRGRINHAKQGWWVAGAAPWGTKRKDTRTGRVLEDGEPSTPGGGGTILVPDESLKLWDVMAKRILGGASQDAIGNIMFAKGIRGPRNGNLSHSSIRNFLTNPALIGIVEYSEEERDGERERVRVKAKWEPMVEVDTFNEVTKILGGRSRSTREGYRRHRDVFPLTPTCGHCGCAYVGGRLAKAQGAKPGYTHAKPKARMDSEGRKSFDEQGCKVWYVDGKELETKVKDLIVQQRSSQDFEEGMRGLLLERDDYRKTASAVVDAARRTVEERQAQVKRLVRLATAVGTSGSDKDDDEFADTISTAKQAVAAAKEKLLEAERFAASKEDAWARLSGIIHETRNLAAAWETASSEDRKILLDYWVVDVTISVEPIPGMLRANRKTAIVTLRTAPGTPLIFEIEGAQSATARKAASSAATTDGSSSTSRRARRAPVAEGEPILPSAHAACDRTNASGSQNASASAGTSSSDPMLPSTTDALRLSPRNLARFIGEPLNAVEKSAGDIDSSEVASERAPIDASAALGANAGSESSLANLWLNGHTS
jgi:hypothetical protein